MRVVVIMNAGAGSIGHDKCDALAAKVAAAFETAGVEVVVICCEGKDLTATARDAAARGVDAVVAAGGDGTVSAVAAALIGGTVPLAVLPLGTLNHFAKDLGMPADLDAAARVIAGQHRRAVDAGEVNQRSFINNASIGLYPEMVVARDAQQQQLGRSKWWAMFIAALRVLRRFPLLAVQVVTPERTLASKTPFIFVGNNPYATTVLTLGERPRLDTGLLGVYFIRTRSRLRMFGLMVRALLQRLDAVRDFETMAVRAATVQLRRRSLDVALDGEVVRLRSPLEFRTRAGALPVLGPAPTARLPSTPAVGVGDDA